jgi:hypothetical protein
MKTQMKIQKIICIITIILDLLMSVGLMISYIGLIDGDAVFGPLTSQTPEGRMTISIIVVWTLILAISCLSLEQRYYRLEKEIKKNITNHS